MYQTIDELMLKASCTAFPERWREIYDEAMDAFDREGCEWLDPDRYDRLGDEYGVLVLYRDVYKEAAARIAENEALSRLLALLVRALKDRELASADLKVFKAPKSPTGEHDIAYDMLTALAIASLVPYSNELLLKRGLPEEVRLSILRAPEKCINEFRKRNGGAFGYHLIEWSQRSIEGRLFRIGRLEIEIFAKYPSRVAVFRSKMGEVTALADDITLHRDGFALGSFGYKDEEGSFLATVTETDDAYVGYPVLQDGYVSKETVSLPKSDYELVLKRGDPIVSLHIPPDGRLDAAAVDETLEETKRFLKEYFPDYEYKGFYCGSWLLDPQLEQLLGEDSNIVRFGKRFRRVTAKSGGRAVFNFVFLTLDPEVDLAALPENTRLERALKQHYLDGKCIYEMHGFFF